MLDLPRKSFQILHGLSLVSEALPSTLGSIYLAGRANERKTVKEPIVERQPNRVSKLAEQREMASATPSGRESTSSFLCEADFLHWKLIYLPYPPRVSEEMELVSLR